MLFDRVAQPRTRPCLIGLPEREGRALILKPGTKLLSHLMDLGEEKNGGNQTVVKSKFYFVRYLLSEN